MDETDLAPSSNSTVAERNFPVEILSLTEDFIEIFRAWPTYEQAIVNRYWQELDPIKDQGNYVRFEYDGKRYAVRLKLDHHKKYAHVSFKRRSSEGIVESDLPGTSTEDLNDYWQEQFQLRFGPDSISRHIIYSRQDPDNPDKLQSFLDEEALPYIRQIRNELRGSLPIEAKPVDKSTELISE